MILVTGGTGLVGSYLLYELIRKGHKVKALIRPDNKYDTHKIFRCLLSDTEEHLSNSVEWVEGDILDPFSLHHAMIGIDYVYHCAALVSFVPSDLKKLIETNVEGTANVVNACIENGIKKLCYVSSIASLGQAEKGEFIDENAKWKTSKSNNGYSISKYGGEREVWRGIEEGLNAVIVNPSIIIGAGCHKRAVNPMFRNVRNLLPFYTSGTKGYVDVRDVVKAMILLMESKISGERYLLNSENLSMKEFMTKVARAINKPDPWFCVPNNLLFGIARLDELRGKLTGTRPLFTKGGIRAAVSKSYYSADKFKSAFQFQFIPIEESLNDAFRAMDALK